jgi:hypothetical protein
VRTFVAGDRDRCRVPRRRASSTLGIESDPVTESSKRPERRRAMTAQSTYLKVDAVGVFPSLLLFLVFVLTLLGVVAHAAFV